MLAVRYVYAKSHAACGPCPLPHPNSFALQSPRCSRHGRLRGIQRKIGGDTANKPCGIGSVGFPRPLLPVAIGAVSLQNERRAVSARATELPLRPHCNLCHILIDSLGAFLGSLGSFLASFAIGVSRSDRRGFRKLLVTVRCSAIHHNRSRQATLQAACVPPCRFS